MSDYWFKVLKDPSKGPLCKYTCEIYRPDGCKVDYCTSIPTRRIAIRWGRKHLKKYTEEAQPYEVYNSIEGPVE